MRKDKEADWLIRAMIAVLREERRRQGKRQVDLDTKVASFETGARTNPSLRTFLVWCRELELAPEVVLVEAQLRLTAERSAKVVRVKGGKKWPRPDLEDTE